MDSSALESISRSLESSLDCLAIWLALCTSLVVVGLIVEYWHDAKEFWLHVRWPMAVFPWDKVKTLIGGILVTLGVAGELVVAYKASRKEIDLRNNNGLIIASLKDRASLTELKLAQTEHENIKLQIQLASVRRVNGPRYLTKDEQNQLVKELLPYRVTRAPIWCNENDGEADRFASDFFKVFTRLKWPTNRSYMSTFGAVQIVQGKRVETVPLSAGIIIGVDDPAHPPKAAKALQRALRNLDFPFDARISGAWWGKMDKPVPDFFELAIGQHP